MYQITPAIRAAAKKLGITIKGSTRKNKKLDAFVDGVYQCSFGDINYSDYHMYQRTHGIDYAKKRRALYRQRHKGEGEKKYGSNGKLTPGYCAWHILW